MLFAIYRYMISFIFRVSRHLIRNMDLLRKKRKELEGEAVQEVGEKCEYVNEDVTVSSQKMEKESYVTAD